MDSTTGPDAPTTGRPADDDAAPAADAVTGGTETAPANREAARYRRQLRDAEADRDRLVLQVQAMQKAEVERLAGRLAQPSALWATTGLADLLDAAGQVDPNKVAAAVENARTQLGLATVSGTPAPSSEGRYPKIGVDRWSTAFGPRPR